MFSIREFIDFMKGKFDVAVEINAVGEEAVLLYHEEVDENLIPQEILTYLPNPIQFNIYSINDEYEWIVGVALAADTYDPLYLVCLKDGERVYQTINGLDKVEMHKEEMTLRCGRK
ncbi:hypothetical protein J2Z37_002295 [Ammoniphilus resinae]|uniref:Uncharacterized protein n=2 Tax=Ammoniphilus resinae TaxID=861532 RepID=A0ABS4GPV1_9BACL|nr:hypothetical protein [Ammoniphilus resinae]